MYFSNLGMKGLSSPQVTGTLQCSECAFACLKGHCWTDLAEYYSTIRNAFAVNVRGRQTRDTLWRQHWWRDLVFQMSLSLPRVQDLWRTQKKLFLEIFRNISCVRAARNNVAAFCHGRATSKDTMLPPQCALVLPEPQMSPLEIFISLFDPIKQTGQSFHIVTTPTGRRGA